jgi:hypothetical protein
MPETKKPAPATTPSNPQEAPTPADAWEQLPWPDPTPDLSTPRAQRKDRERQRAEDQWIEQYSSVGDEVSQEGEMYLDAKRAEEARLKNPPPIESHESRLQRRRSLVGGLRLHLARTCESMDIAEISTLLGIDTAETLEVIRQAVSTNAVSDIGSGRYGPYEAPTIGARR